MPAHLSVPGPVLDVQVYPVNVVNVTPGRHLLSHRLRGLLRGQPGPGVRREAVSIVFLVLVILDARTHCLPRNVTDYHYHFRQTGVLDRCTRQV